MQHNAVSFFSVFSSSNFSVQTFSLYTRLMWQNTISWVQKNILRRNSASASEDIMASENDNDNATSGDANAFTKNNTNVLILYSDANRLFKEPRSAFNVIPSNSFSTSSKTGYITPDGSVYSKDEYGAKKIPNDQTWNISNQNVNLNNSLIKQNILADDNSFNKDSRSISIHEKELCISHDFVTKTNQEQFGELPPVAEKLYNTYNKGGNSPIIDLPLEEVVSNKSYSIMEIKIKSKYTMKSISSHKTIILVGATGAGKSTLINGIINYIMGTKLQNKFRFRLVQESTDADQAISQTSKITAYNIPQINGSRVKFPLTIIDTPGFGDTRGIENDKKITNQMREFFESAHGPELRMVGFITQSSLPRLTPTQKYIFDSILSIFGKNIAEIIFLFITFADASKPPVLAGIKAAAVPHNEKQFFKFNNSALFEFPSDEDSSDFNAMFWNLGEKSFSAFFLELKRMRAQSLTMTNDVLKHRRHIETKLNGLMPQVKETLSKMNYAQQLHVAVSQNEAIINANKDFIIASKIVAYRRVGKPDSIFVTNCLCCQRTCHDNCVYRNDAEKVNCSAMNKDGLCTVCPGKCRWDQHVNQNFLHEAYEKTEQITSEDMKRRYQDAKSKKIDTQNILRNIEVEYSNKKKELFQMLIDIRKSLKELDSLALRRNPLSLTDYIETLINAEQSEVKVGWQERIVALKNTKQEAELLSKLAAKGQSEDKIIEQLLQEEQYKKPT